MRTMILAVALLGNLSAAVRIVPLVYRNENATAAVIVALWALIAVLTIVKPLVEKKAEKQ